MASWSLAGSSYPLECLERLRGVGMGKTLFAGKAQETPGEKVTSTRERRSWPQEGTNVKMMERGDMGDSSMSDIQN